MRQGCRGRTDVDVVFATHLLVMKRYGRSAEEFLTIDHIIAAGRVFSMLSWPIMRLPSTVSLLLCTYFGRSTRYRG